MPIPIGMSSTGAGGPLADLTTARREMHSKKAKKPNQKTGNTRLFTNVIREEMSLIRLFYRTAGTY
jgi:hypothetical protein